MTKIEIQVRDGLKDFDFVFSGREVASETTEQPGRHQWVEMDLYWADPGQDVPLLKLPDGGYVTHVVGQSVRAHRHNASCAGGGLEVAVSDMIAEALPCPQCRPQFPRMKYLRPESFRDDEAFEIAVAQEEQRVYAARANLTGTVDLETPRHSIRRSITAADFVRHIIGDRLSSPAQRLLRKAADADPAIKAAMDDPVIALAIQEALVSAGRVVLSS